MVLTLVLEGIEVFLKPEFAAQKLLICQLKWKEEGPILAPFPMLQDAGNICYIWQKSTWRLLQKLIDSF